MQRKIIFGSAVLSVSLLSAATPALNTNRTEVVDFFSENVYGVRPDLSSFRKTCSVTKGEWYKGVKAYRHDVTLNVATPLGEKTFTAVAFLPEGATAKTPVPTFVYLSFAKPDDMFDNAPGSQPYRWQVNEIVAHGFATVGFYYRDVFPDKEDPLAATFGKDATRPANGWGGISAWALAASRVMDWIETEPRLDASKVAVVGHSRLGKTALWAGATDPRFALVCVNDSGCMGARASTRNIADPGTVNWWPRAVNCGETLESITRIFPHWFAPQLRAKFAKVPETELPFDQHWLVAAVAPRLIAVASATEDQWSCPSGEHAGLDLARPAWGAAQDRCHYHARQGGHDINEIDWREYLAFAERHGWKGVTAAEAEPEEWDWIEAKDFGIEGQAFAETDGVYGRLPRGGFDDVPAWTLELGRTSAGLSVRFKTDGDKVRVKAVIDPVTQARVRDDYYMTPHVQIGFDWYEWDAKADKWLYVNHPWPALCDYSTDGEIPTKPGVPVLVNFPLRGIVKSVKLGVPKGRTLTRLPPHRLAAKPVVHYGTSIVHGGCVTRPGLCFTSQASRRADVEWVNLGFSGSARMEMAMCTNLLARIDASLYVIDPIWNMDIALVKERYEPFVRELRRRRPDTPILLCEDVQSVERKTEKGLWVRAFYERLRAEGWKNLHLLRTDEQLPADPDLTLDRCHPNDAGAAILGRVFADKVRSILMHE